MDRERMEDLVGAYLDRTLEGADADELVAQLRENPEARRYLLLASHTDVALFDQGRARASALRRPSRSRWRIALVAGLLLALTLPLLRPSEPIPSGKVAILQEATAGVTVGDRPGVAGTEILIDEPIRIAPAGQASLLVTDGTRVQAGPDTSLHVRPREIVVEKGSLTAHVARQTDGHRLLFRTPDAEVEVLGTILRLDVAPRSTRLHVLEGKVRMKSLSDSRVVEVVAGHYEIVAPGFIVSPRGTPQGDGSLSKPWDLSTALIHPAVMPGDRILLRAGVYKGLFRSALRGRAGAPVEVRAFGRERATVDGGIEARGEWTTFRGFEITNSGPDRGPQRPAGLVLFGRGHRAINLIVHDTGNPGIAFREEVGDGGEVSGCILWGNGVVLPDGTRAGSGVSAQNREGTRRIRETIAFRNYQSGLFVFAEQGSAEGFQLEGNIVFDHPKWGILATGGENPISSLRVAGNVSFSRRSATDGDLIRFGLVPQARNGSIEVQQNVFVLGLADEAFHLFQWKDVRVTGNTIVGRHALARWTPGDAGARVWNDNAYFTDGVGAFLVPDARLGYSDWKAKTGFDEDSTLTPWAPGDAKILVRPNPHEPGRAHVIVIHGERRRSVAADLSGVLQRGEGYIVRDAEDYFGPAAAQGTFDGTPILLPAAREFAVFVVESTGPR